MSSFLHPEFLRSEEAFDACSEFWQALFARALQDAGLDATTWKPWLPRHFGGGALMPREDRPVFFAYQKRPGFMP